MSARITRLVLHWLGGATAHVGNSKKTSTLRLLRAKEPLKHFSNPTWHANPGDSNRNIWQAYRLLVLSYQNTTVGSRALLALAFPHHKYRVIWRLEQGREDTSTSSMLELLNTCIEPVRPVAQEQASDYTCSR